jgi:hypothetical protein
MAYTVLVSQFSRIFCVYEMKHRLSCKEVLLSSDAIIKIGVCMRPDGANNKKSHNETAPLRHINKIVLRWRI